MPSRPRPRPATPKPAAKPAGARRRVPARTREELVAAAAALFRAEGLDAPSLDAICERAGYTRGAFYVHFATRDELVGAVVEKALSDLLESIIPEGQVDLAGVVDGFVAALAGGSLALAGHVRISQVLEACVRSWTLRVKLLSILVSARERIAGAVRHGQAEGTVRGDVSPDAVAELLLALVLGVLSAAQLEAPYDARQVRTDLLGMLAVPAGTRERASDGPTRAQRPRARTGRS